MKFHYFKEMILSDLNNLEYYHYFRFQMLYFINFYNFLTLKFVFEYSKLSFSFYLLHLKQLFNLYRMNYYNLDFIVNFLWNFCFYDLKNGCSKFNSIQVFANPSMDLSNFYLSQLLIFYLIKVVEYL